MDDSPLQRAHTTEWKTKKTTTTDKTKQNWQKQTKQNGSKCTTIDYSKNKGRQIRF